MTKYECNNCSEKFDDYPSCDECGDEIEETIICDDGDYHYCSVECYINASGGTISELNEIEE